MTAGASGHTNKAEVVHASRQVVLTEMTQQVVDSHRGKETWKTIICITQFKTQNKKKNKNKEKQQGNKQEEKRYIEITRYTEENKNKQGEDTKTRTNKNNKKKGKHNDKSNKIQNKQKHMK